MVLYALNAHVDALDGAGHNAHKPAVQAGTEAPPHLKCLPGPCQDQGSSSLFVSRVSDAVLSWQSMM